MIFVPGNLATRGVLRMYLIAIMSGSFDSPASFKLIARATLTPIPVTGVARRPDRPAALTEVPRINGRNENSAHQAKFNAPLVGPFVLICDRMLSLFKCLDKMLINKRASKICGSIAWACFFSSRNGNYGSEAAPPTLDNSL